MKLAFPPLPLVAALLFMQAAFAESADRVSSETRQHGEKQTESIDEITVLGLRKASYTEITEDAEKLLNMPGALGDPLGAVTALPGVIIPRSGGSPAVRGSAPGDNRYYIDGLPAGYIFHEFNTSIFDENVLQDFQLFSAGFGVQYSEATGAVFDIRLRDPEHKPLTTTISASFLRAGAFIESGVTENTAFYLSARKGLLQYFVPEEDEANDEGFRVISAPEDYDYQFKYKWDIGGGHSLTLSLAGAGDFAEAEFTELAEFVQKNPDFAGDAKIDREFDSAGGSYEYFASSGALLRLTLGNYSDSHVIHWGEGYFIELRQDSNLASLNYSLPLGGGHVLSVGGEYNDKRFAYSARVIQFVCTDFDVDCQSGRRDLLEDTEDLPIAETSVYIADNWQITGNFGIEAGIQRSGNNHTGEYHINPRIAITWDLNTALTLISSVGRYSRTPDIETILPAFGNPELKSPRATHLTLGLKGETGDAWTWLVEGYRKTLTGLPLALDETQPDAALLYSNDVEGDVLGVDIMINKNLSERWFGWMSLSLAESRRTNLRSGETRNYTLDTPAVFNLVANRRLRAQWTGGLRFSYRSGEATTAITGIAPNPDFPDRYLPVYGEAYGTRLPYYARLDARFERELRLFGKPSRLFFDILNVLNRKNVTERTLDYEKVNETGALHLRNSGSMGIFGSAGLSMTF